MPCRYHYITSWFWLDALACLPLECILFTAAPHVNWYNTPKFIRYTVDRTLMPQSAQQINCCCNCRLWPCTSCAMLFGHKPLLHPRLLDLLMVNSCILYGAIAAAISETLLLFVIMSPMPVLSSKTVPYCGFEHLITGYWPGPPCHRLHYCSPAKLPRVAALCAEP